MRQSGRRLYEKTNRREWQDRWECLRSSYSGVLLVIGARDTSRRLVRYEPAYNFETKENRTPEHAFETL